MSVRFAWSYQGIGEMLRSDGMIADMRRRAENVMAEAVANAPVGDPGGTWPDPHPGLYRAGFHVESGVRSRGKTRRAYGRATNDAPHALAVEYGWGKTPRYRTLGTALFAAAGR
jgi:hypothetical protein